jgi:acyl-coenzyme A synthetase/AMP-(fatty) acid ligase
LGNQVAPAELESILLGHGSVADVCVVGKPHDKAGEVPWAFVVVKHANEGLGKELLKWVEEKVVRYKRLGGITFVDKIEKNASGKILRRVYRDRFKREEAKLKAKL